MPAGRPVASTALFVLVTCAWRYGAAPSLPPKTPTLAEVEAFYADTSDALGAISAIDSGLFSSYQHKDHAAWEHRYREKRKLFEEGLTNLSPEGLSQSDTRAVSLLRSSLESSLPENPAGASLSNISGNCKDAGGTDLPPATLKAALYSCFDELGNHLAFEGHAITRVSAFALLAQMEDAARRKALFLSFVPLWEGINGHNEPNSPYRRRIRNAVADGAEHGTPIDAAARTVGVPSMDVERWLEQILDEWRQVSGDQAIEPWDYRYLAGEADRTLAAAIPRAALESVNQRYYHDLGADLKQLGVLYDLDPRPGKAPLAYTTLVTMGRLVNGNWQPTISRVSASYADGSLSSLNELVHENGHAVHYSALHTRPAFMDLGDAVFFEAFADVTSWDVYDPEWQQKYLGRQAPFSASLRSQYSGVMLDVAWSLFEARMLRKPEGDPNAVWTEITSRYLHIVPHPEYSWWAQRVQLVEDPGYMVNYGLGAVITAEIRARVRKALGASQTGNKDWYPWISTHLLRFGMERETRDLLRDFLARPVSPQALLDDVHRLRAGSPAS